MVDASGRTDRRTRSSSTPPGRGDRPSAGASGAAPTMPRGMLEALLDWPSKGADSSSRRAGSRGRRRMGVDVALHSGRARIGIDVGGESCLAGALARSPDHPWRRISRSRQPRGRRPAVGAPAPSRARARADQDDDRITTSSPRSPGRCRQWQAPCPLPNSIGPGGCRAPDRHYPTSSALARRCSCPRSPLVNGWRPKAKLDGRRTCPSTCRSVLHHRGREGRSVGRRFQPSRRGRRRARASAAAWRAPLRIRRTRRVRDRGAADNESAAALAISVNLRRRDRKTTCCSRPRVDAAPSVGGVPRAGELARAIAPSHRGGTNFSRYARGNRPRPAPTPPQPPSSASFSRCEPARGRRSSAARPGRPTRGVEQLVGAQAASRA